MTRLGNILKALAEKPAADAADYIVELGEKSGWEYERWASGNVVLRMTIVKNKPVNSSWGQFNITESVDFGPYPVKFTEAPLLSATASANSYSLIAVVTEDPYPKEHAPYVNAGRPAEQYIDSGIDIRFQVVVRGRCE